jgi:hypothetical protein
VRRWESGGVQGVEPWYNVTGFEKSCPSGCQPCASCSKRDEKELRALVRPEGCDCSKDPGIDPCFSPRSCGCYCERYTYLSKQCPHVGK